MRNLIQLEEEEAFWWQKKETNNSLNARSTNQMSSQENQNPYCSYQSILDLLKNFQTGDSLLEKLVNEFCQLDQFRGSKKQNKLNQQILDLKSIAKEKKNSSVSTQQKRINKNEQSNKKTQGKSTTKIYQRAISNKQDQNLPNLKNEQQEEISKQNTKDILQKTVSNQEQFGQEQLIKNKELNVQRALKLQKNEFQKIILNNQENMSYLKSDYEQKQEKRNQKLIKGLIMDILNNQSFKEFINKEAERLAQNSRLSEQTVQEIQDSLKITYKFQLYDYLNQQAKNFQLNQIQLTMLAIILERNALEEYIQNYALIIPINAFIVLQKLSQRNQNIYQISQELLNQEGFTVIFNLYTSSIRNDSGIKKSELGQINIKYNQLIRLSKQFTKQIDWNQKFQRLYNQIEILRKLNDQNQNLAFTVKIKGQDNETDAIMKIINKLETQEIIQAIERGNRVQLVQNQTQESVQQIDEKYFSQEKILKGEQLEFAKKQINFLLNIVKNGLIPQSILKNKRIYFPEQNDNSSYNAISKTQHFDYWNNSHGNDILSIDLRFIKELRQLFKNLFDQHTNKKLEFQALSYEKICGLAN